MTTAVSPAIATLESLLDAGAFASQLKAYLNRTFRHSDRENWYKKAVEAEGCDAAERQLTEWVKSQHRDVYGSSIEPIARGIVALAKAKDDSLVDITACTTNVYSSINDQYGPRGKFIVFNTQAPGCGCMQPAGSYTWSPYGEIGLQAIILETGYTDEGPAASMTLILPAWARNGQTVGEGTILFAKIESTGYSSGERYNLSTVKGEGDNMTEDKVTDANLGLQYLLGMTEPSGKLWLNSVGSDIDQVIGFPGAEDYLAAKLPSLGDYFVALAEKLSTPHKH